MTTTLARTFNNHHTQINITTISNSSPIKFKQLHEIITDLRFEQTDQSIYKQEIQNSKNLKCANEIEMKRTF